MQEWIHDQTNHDGLQLNPYQVKSFAESQGKRAKTDLVDARTIARFAEMTEASSDSPQNEAYRRLKELTRHLEHLKKRRQQEANYKESVNDPRRKADAEASIEMYDEQIDQVKSDIEDVIDEHPDLGHNQELITSIPGIGDTVAQLLLAELQNGDTPSELDVKQEVASAGLDPQIEQSGTSLDHSQLSKRGNPRLRKALYLPALTAIRFNPIIKDFYERLRSRGKAKMVAVCASMRKLLHLVVGVLKNQAHFDPNWQNS